VTFTAGNLATLEPIKKKKKSQVEDLSKGTAPIREVSIILEPKLSEAKLVELLFNQITRCGSQGNDFQSSSEKSFVLN